MHKIQEHHIDYLKSKSRLNASLVRLTCLSGFIFFSFLPYDLLSQNLNHQQFWDSLLSIERAEVNFESKLQLVYSLKNDYEKSGNERDSVYARMLHRIGYLKFRIASNLINNKNQVIQISRNINEAIKSTQEAARINTSGKKNACLAFASTSYSNLGYYCKEIQKYKNALAFYDSSILIGQKYPEDDGLVEMAYLYKGEIYYKTGDYQQIISETSIGLKFSENISDTEYMVDFLNKRAEAYEMLGQYKKALDDLSRSTLLLQVKPNGKALINVCLTKAKIAGDQKDFSTAQILLKKLIIISKKENDDAALANDYNEAGLVLQFKCNNPDEALKLYVQAAILAEKSNATLLNIFTNENIGQVYFDKQQFKEALVKTQEGILLCTGNKFYSKDLLNNPDYKDLLFFDSKNYLITLLDNKAECLLSIYTNGKDKKYLAASITTALLVDSLATYMRHEQIQEQSKLYWTNFTRQFYFRTIEACYLANNPSLAFYFMEKSRAVLLNDKLNEIGATAQLPASEAAKQENLQINIVEQQQKLYSLDESSPQYTTQQILLLKAKDDYEHYIKSLEQKYPAYYQYKYADEVPSLDSLKKYLTKNNQSFVDYFLGDTVTYILSVTPTTTKFIKLSKEQFNKNQLNDFIQYCSNKELLNNHYNSFAKLAQNLYNNLFGPLQIQKGSIIICPDNFLIPFEALCTDADGKNFLLTNFSFTYVYSARYFLAKQNITTNVSGNFIGMAPVSFSNYLKVPDLINSGNALTNAAENYSRTKILIQKNATRKNFFQQIGNYNIANIFSHAYADSTNSEPKLYMQDSVIRLSELQFINHPATQIVVLSACETNVGKNATGEGIYSLARGFASVGVPSVSATLWKADEETIYSITELFNKNLAAGMQKDVALQQAKLTFLQNNQNEKLLPYFWANMVLVGNTEPVSLSKDSKLWLWLTIGSVFVLIILALFYFKRTNK